MVIVGAHLLSIIVMVIPIFMIILLQRVSYAPFSLIPSYYILTKEDVLRNFWILPVKLEHEVAWVQAVVQAILLFWGLGFIDLIVYYYWMSFPQEAYFLSEKQKQIEAKFQQGESSAAQEGCVSRLCQCIDTYLIQYIKKLSRWVMWLTVLLSLFATFVYLVICLVWLILGAIVSPTVFLPYATAAATFVTVISTKYAEVQKLIKDGFKTVYDYVMKMADQQINGMLKKMDLGGKVQSLVNSEALQGVAGQAAKLGLVDESTIKEMEEKAVQLSKDPKKLAEAGSALADLAANPQEFANKMLKAMEEKAISMVKERIQKKIEGPTGE